MSAAYGENAVLREAQRAHQEDRPVAALALLDSVGATYGGATLGWYRIVQAEAAVRALDERRTYGTVTIEPDADPEPVLAAFREVTDRFGPTDFPMLVTFLPVEADAPWHSARYGYYERRTETDKVCIPSGVAERELRPTLLHEFAHAVVQNRTAGRAPKWLHEGIAQLAEGRRPVVRRTRTTWDPVTLDAAFEDDRRAEGGWTRVGTAYEAANRIVARLHREKGDEGLRELLDAFVDNSFLTEARIALGEDPAAEAVRQVYGLTLDELFAVA